MVLAFVLLASLAHASDEDTKDTRNLLTNALKAEIGLSLTDPLTTLLLGKDSSLDKTIFKVLLSDSELKQYLPLSPLGKLLQPTEFIKFSEEALKPLLTESKLLELLLSPGHKHKFPLPVPLPVHIPKPLHPKPLPEPLPLPPKPVYHMPEPPAPHYMAHPPPVYMKPHYLPAMPVYKAHAPLVRPHHG